MLEWEYFLDQTMQYPTEKHWRYETLTDFGRKPWMLQRDSASSHKERVNQFIRRESNELFLLIMSIT